MHWKSQVLCSSVGCFQSILSSTISSLRQPWELLASIYYSLSHWSHSFVPKKKKKGLAAFKSTDISEVYIVSFKGEQRVTSDSSLSSCLLHSSPLLRSSPALCCSLSAGEEVDLRGSGTNPLGFSMSTQRPSNLLYLPLPLLHTQSLFLALSAFSYLPSASPSPNLSVPFFPSLPCCLCLSLSYWFL